MCLTRFGQKWFHRAERHIRVSEIYESLLRSKWAGLEEASGRGGGKTLIDRANGRVQGEGY